MNAHMEIGLVSLDNMGISLALTMKSKGHDVIVCDLNETTLKSSETHDIKTTWSLKEMAENISSKRVIWLMIPDGNLVDKTLDSLIRFLSVGDVIIDGANAAYHDSIRRARALEPLQINFLDCGISERVNPSFPGFRMMIGGNRFAFNHCETLFKDVSVPDGYLYCGRSGSGHFVNMILSRIEDGLKQSIAEGFEVMRSSEFNLKLEKVAEVWSQDSTVRKWLMEIAENKN
jgi:6-phosphogluconate dehydrogenase